MVSYIMALFVDGGFWMYPVALVGMVGILLALVNSFSRNSKTEWVITLLALSLVVGMIGAFFRMSFALEYIAAGPEGQKIWIPWMISALGVLPPYLAIILAAIGSGLLGISSAYRNRADIGSALFCLTNGCIVSCILICFANLVYTVPEMFMVSANLEDASTGMALGMATHVQNVIWPATIAMLLLFVRMIALLICPSRKAA